MRWFLLAPILEEPPACVSGPLWCMHFLVSRQGGGQAVLPHGFKNCFLFSQIKCRNWIIFCNRDPRKSHDVQKHSHVVPVGNLDNLKSKTTHFWITRTWHNMQGAVLRDVMLQLVISKYRSVCYTSRLQLSWLYIKLLPPLKSTHFSTCNIYKSYPEHWNMIVDTKS